MSTMEQIENEIDAMHIEQDDTRYGRKTTLGFLPTTRDGIQFTDDTQRALGAARGHPKSDFGGAVGTYVVREGIVTFCFTIRSNATSVQMSEIAVGVADASAELTPIKGGQAIGFHIGKSRIVRSKNGHKRGSGRMLSPDTPRKVPADRDGRIVVLAVVDMETRRLAIALNQGRPVDTGYELPEAVRPWVWFGGPGVGEVELVEYSALTEPPSSRPMARSASLAAPAPAPMLSTVSEDDAAGVGVGAAPTVTTLYSKRAASALDTLEAKKGAPASPTSTIGTMDTGSNDSAAPELTEWDARASAWLSPLQSFFWKQEQASNAEVSA